MKILKYISISIVLVLLVIGGYILFSSPEKLGDMGIKFLSQFDKKDISPTPGELEKDLNGSVVETVANNLEIPWEIVFLPDGSMLVTERPGKLTLINENKESIQIEGVQHVGEGGLLGAVLHPDFENNNYIYLYYTTGESNSLENTVVRYVFENNTLTEDKVIISGIGGASYHDGGRMSFGPDGYLYIATGDAGNEDSAQDINSLLGKILRLDDEGNIPEDNPFGNEVYSYGHRNPQGLAWDDQGRLWSTEHGPSGSDTGQDELNLIEKGNNYGWPMLTGDDSREGFVSPVIQSGRDTTWAPAGAVFYKGKIWFAGLRGNGLYGYDIETGVLTKDFGDSYGRLRAVTLGPDNYLYVSTSNRDGRGQVRDGDDKILKINLDLLIMTSFIE